VQLFGLGVGQLSPLATRLGRAETLLVSAMYWRHYRGLRWYLVYKWWSWQSASYFYFGTLLGQVKNKEVCLLQQG